MRHPPCLCFCARVRSTSNTARLGLTDASIVALAEELGIVRIATRDVRHFSATQTLQGRHFELVVRPSNPDKGR
jgi:hypothetical protein